MKQMFSFSDTQIERALQTSFGLRAFRPGQREAIEALLSGRDLLAVMPTGAGKSLCFQLPAIVHPGLTLVISPLIALMKDQVDTLKRRGIRAAYLASTQSARERSAVRRALHAGQLDLLYVSPERLNEASFVDQLSQLAVWLVAVDEAHCISAWGIDFRPDYLRIPEAIERLPKRPVLAAFTATATPSVRDDLIEQLGQRDPQRVLAGFDRPNLRFLVSFARGKAARSRQLVQEVRSRPGSGIVYAGTRKASEEQATALRRSGRSAIAYHAGLSSEERHEAQEAFLSGEVDVIVATNAFGMGIDKPDVRFVIHTTMPPSPDAYYQEAGRAGRDGLPADVLLLYVNSDRQLQEWLIDQDLPTIADLQRLHQAVQRSNGQLDIGAVARNFGDETLVRVGLQALAQAEVITLGVRQGSEQLIATGLSSLGQQQMRQMERALARQRHHRLRLLEEMVIYAQSDQCRRATLLHYFDDPNAAPGGNASCCDICAGGPGASAGKQQRIEQARKLVRPRRLSRRRAAVLEALQEYGGVRDAARQVQMTPKYVGQVARELVTQGQLDIETMVPSNVLQALEHACRQMDEAGIDYLHGRPGYLTTAMRFCPTGTDWDHLALYMAHLRRQSKLADLSPAELEQAATSRPRREKPDQSTRYTQKDTVTTSLELFQSGKTIDEIAAERGLKPVTIEGHLIDAVRDGRLSMSTFVDDGTTQIVRQALDQTPASETPLRDIRATATELAGRDVTYLEINVVRAATKAQYNPTQQELTKLLRRKQKAEQLREQHEREGRPWPANWDAEYQRILQRIAELKADDS